jgi:thiol-disulfide isomerase/thioredoxin
MITIKIIGTTPPCVKCKRVEQEAQKAAQKFAGQVRVLKLDALSAEAQQYGLVVTPMVVINDQVVSSGKVLNAEQIERELKKVTLGGE